MAKLSNRTKRNRGISHDRGVRGNLAMPEAIRSRQSPPISNEYLVARSRSKYEGQRSNSYTENHYRPANTDSLI
ncbi:MAG: hypothetical protein AABY05_03675 [Nanoarchaeota archaeon]